LKIFKLRDDIPSPISYKAALPDSFKNYPHKLNINFQGGTIIPDLPTGDHDTICRDCQSGNLCELAKTEIDFFENKQKLRSIKSIKYCPAVEDIHKVGYVLPAWDDITIVNHNLEGKDRMLAFDSKGQGVASLKFEQMDVKNMIGDLFNNYPVKFHFPYRVVTERGHLTQILNPEWLGFNTKYTFATGILDTSVWSLMNIHAFFNLKKDESLLIKKGTPLVLLQEVHHSIFQSNYEVIEHENIDYELLEKFDYNEHLQDINKTNYRAMQRKGLKEKP
jgi:hypothetical protein